jgi:hypothetical protein
MFLRRVDAEAATVRATANVSGSNSEPNLVGAKRRERGTQMA